MLCHFEQNPAKSKFVLWVRNGLPKLTFPKSSKRLQNIFVLPLVRDDYIIGGVRWGLLSRGTLLWVQKRLILTLPVWQYVGKETRGRFFNGCQWRRGFTTLNKQLFRGNSSSFNESTAYLLIYNMFYTKQYFWIELFLEFTPKKNAVL